MGPPVNNNGGAEVVAAAATSAAAAAPHNSNSNNSRKDWMLEQTIQHMQDSSICGHPTHYHSFQQVNFSFFSSHNKCAGCQGRLQSIVLFGGGGHKNNNNNNSLLRCLACGAMAHRACALSTSNCSWKDVCPVNAAHLIKKNNPEKETNMEAAPNSPTTKQLLEEGQQQQQQQSHMSEPAPELLEEEEATSTHSLSPRSEDGRNVFQPKLTKNFPSDEQDEDEEADASTHSHGPVNQAAQAVGSFLRDKLSPQRPKNNPAQQQERIVTAKNKLQPLSMALSSQALLWQQSMASSASSRSLNRNTSDASEAAPMSSSSSSASSSSSCSDPEDAMNHSQDKDGDSHHHPHDDCSSYHDAAAADDTERSALHFTSHPFASVARGLQENILAHFSQHNNNDSSGGGGYYARVPQNDDQLDDEELNDCEYVDVVSSTSTSKNKNDKSATGTVSSSNRFQLPPAGTTAAVAGGIAGGVAGLVIAGPAGAYAASQVAGALGVLAEGSVTLGVIVASAATASITAQELQHQFVHNRHHHHILTMGEAGTKRKVLLVRPNIQIDDPVWEEIAARARSTAPKHHLASFGGLLSKPALTELSRERYRRDSDIIKTAETEISTDEKILLLVSRILSDKSSVPGHIYRQLIQAFRDRCREREQEENQQRSLSPPSSFDSYDDFDYSETTAAAADSLHSNSSSSSDTHNHNHNKTHDDTTKTTSADFAAAKRRARRDDAHAVIKHVTAALLELRPEFASSPAVTELTATAVEGLVFGQLYDLVWDEIVAETAARDAALVEKTRALMDRQLQQQEAPLSTTNRNSSNALLDATDVSQAALDALRMMPKYHSAVDKLNCCVRFLERISDYFSSSTSAGMCAESLLKMVCQHLLVLYLPSPSSPLREEETGSSPSDAAAAATTVSSEKNNIHAQVAFLEEFARDEHLLRGREGYALVTLQAALHFLDMSHDFEKDIFDPDTVDDEDDDELELVVAEQVMETTTTNQRPRMAGKKALGDVNDEEDELDELAGGDDEDDDDELVPGDDELFASEEVVVENEKVNMIGEDDDLVDDDEDELVPVEDELFDLEEEEGGLLVQEDKQKISRGDKLAVDEDDDELVPVVEDELYASEEEELVVEEKVIAEAVSTDEDALLVSVSDQLRTVGRPTVMNNI